MYVGGHEAQQTAADGVFRTSRRPTQENKEGRTTYACLRSTKPGAKYPVGVRERPAPFN
jgi:hypothetical protein